MTNIDRMMLIIITGIVLLMLTGCGSDPGALQDTDVSDTGTITVQVAFPPSDSQAQTADLPEATGSVRIAAFAATPTSRQTSDPAAEKIVQPDASGTPVQTTLGPIPIGSYITVATGYETTDGTGDRIAEGTSRTVNVSAGSNSDVNINTVPLPVRAELSPDCPLAISTYECEGQLVTATAYDADGNPMNDAAFDWSSSDESVATVQKQSANTALIFPAGAPNECPGASGTCTITATETNYDTSHDVQTSIDCQINVTFISSVQTN